MAKSPFYVEARPLTRADELRAQLDELEAMLGRLGYGLGQEALTIPALFDSVSAGLASFKAVGHSMRSEQTRLETVSNRFKKKVDVFLREVGGVESLIAARRERQPDPANWWWYADRLVAERRRRRLRRLFRLGAVVVVILLLLVALYQRFLAPDPATRERIRYESRAEFLITEGDIEGALGEVERALAIVPGDPGLLVLRGTLQGELGQAAAAEETFAAAETTFGDRESFLQARARAYLLLNRPEAALADAREVVELNPESAAGYTLLGRAYEQLEDYMEALLAYQQVVTLAEEQGDFQLAGTARINVGLLMQRLQAQPRDEP